MSANLASVAGVSGSKEIGNSISSRQATQLYLTPLAVGEPESRHVGPIIKAAGNSCACCWLF